MFEPLPDLRLPRRRSLDPPPTILDLLLSLVLVLALVMFL